MKKFLKRFLYFLIPLSAFILYELCHQNPYLTEKIYSSQVYPVLSGIFSYMAKYLPISLAEFLLYAAVIFAVIFVVYIFAALFRKKDFKDKIFAFFYRLQTLAIICGCIYGFFVFFWSLNYARMPLVSHMGYEASLYSAEELGNLTFKLIDRANELRQMVNEDENGYFIMQTDKRESMKKADDIYENNALSFMKKGGMTSIKTHTVPKLLSFGNIQGIYSPFTFEPNVNTDMPDLYFGASCCHEYAHFKGFCREDEAEFIAFYVCYMSDDIDFRYSGTMTALIHALSALRKADNEKYLQAREMICDGIWRDFSQHNLYWDDFEGKAEEVSEAINDNYLKSNKQESGVKSYGRMLDILLAMDRAGDF
ncbi:MAG: DUF3810 domain-containing protein [Christensenellaceae bacterium]|nr:DUF3810 domain-containing protein [Christensenellaceae bacterium]